MATKKTPTLDGSGRIFEKHLPDRLSGPSLSATTAQAIVDSPVVAGKASTSDLAAYAPLNSGNNVPWPSGLVAFWPFTETSQPYRSVRGVGSFELINNSPTVNPVTKSSTVIGPFGPTARFSGGSAALYVPKSQIGALNLARYSKGWTQIWWASHTDTNGSCLGGIWKEDGSGVHARSFSSWLGLTDYGGDRKLCGHISKTGLGSEKVDGSGLLPYSRDLSASRRQIADDDFRFLAVTFDGTQLISYIDGIADSFKNYTEPGAPNGEGLTYDKNPYKGPLNTGWEDGLNDTPEEYTIGVAVRATGTGAGIFNIGGHGVFHRPVLQSELMAIHLATNPSTRPLIKMDMKRPKRNSTGGTLATGTKIDTGAVGMFNARGATAQQSALFGGTVPNDQTMYSYGLSTGRDHIAYDNLQASNQLIPAISGIDYVKSVEASQVKRITASLNNNTTLTKIRFAIRIGTSWYATASQFACASTHTDPGNWATAELAEFTMTRTASAWRDMTFIPGSTLSLGAVRTGKLPAGEVTGYAVYCDEGVGSGGALRFTDLNLWA